MNKKEMSAYFAALGKMGGKAKAKNTSKADRIVNARKMAYAMHKKAGHVINTPLDE